MNQVSTNLTYVFSLLWNALHYTFYFDSIPFTLYDVAVSGLIVGVFATFLSNIVMFWKGKKA